MTIQDIARTVRLTKMVNCTNSVLISEVAKEMGVRKTALMAFIDQNPLLFKVTEMKDARGKTKGLAIMQCYEDEVQNPMSDAWLRKHKADWEKRLQVSEMSYYGVREFLFIQEDSPNDGLRYHLWRNTPEKIGSLAGAGLITKTKTGYGGFGDYHPWEGYLLTKQMRQALEKAGWKLELPSE